MGYHTQILHTANGTNAATHTHTHTHTHYNCRRSFSLTYVPIHRALFLSFSSLSLSCLSRTFRFKSSAKMHPTDHTSMALVYSWQLSMISGARYHRVTTYSVSSRLSLSMPRARPKSQT